jgi:nicotinamidase-related amidase
MRAVDTALLAVDMQERLLAVIPEAERVTWNCRRLVDGARILGVGATFTEQNPEKLGPTAAELARAGTAQLAPLAKMAFSCGACGELHPQWQSAGIERVLLCGIETHVCVQQTALDLLSAGYRVYVAADAVASRNAVDHAWALERMQASGAVITTTEAALFEWCERAGTPEFRQISALAKELSPGG